MRWKFPDPADTAEEQQRQRTLAKIKAWWMAFQSRNADLNALFKRQQSWDLAGWMQQNLQAIDPCLMWEFGPGLTGGHRLVITPESESRLRPLVDCLLQMAPTMKGWEFYAYRVPEGIEGAKVTVQVRSKGDISKTKFLAKKGRYNRVDLIFASPDYTGDQDRQARNDCFVACETLLGEEVLDKRIGYIDVQQECLNTPGLLPIDQLLPEVRKRIDEITKSLPDQPCLEFSNTATWTMYELKPNEAPDYALQSDMYVGKTMLPDMWTCAHSRAFFDSSRFSKLGELFVYLKLDGSEGVEEEKFEDKGAIEDALDEILIAENLGSVIGGGTGKRYSYIDLALTDPPAAFAKIKARLREGNIPRRSWILFFDTYLADEWIGIWDDTPPPPR